MAQVFIKSLYSTFFFYKILITFALPLRREYFCHKKTEKMTREHVLLSYYEFIYYKFCLIINYFFMKKIVLTFSMMLMTFFAGTTYAQVGIGTMMPDKSAALDITADSLGALLPRMTEFQRDNIVKPANGLLIFNVDENCINAWDEADSIWNSLCGGVGKASFSLVCNSSTDLTANGSYVKGVSMNGSNYLSMKVAVDKAGAYTIAASASKGTTPNGYGFTAQGTFLQKGDTVIVQVPAQGKPADIDTIAPYDQIALLFNGSAVATCPNFGIKVAPPTADYDLSCGTAQFSGVYVKGKPLDGSNTVTFDVNVNNIDNGGSWAVISNTVNGISFSGSGMFINPGPQSITLKGTGTPTGIDPITLTFTANSASGPATCSATVTPAIPPMKVLEVGTIQDHFDYPIFVNNTNGYKMVTSDYNFGTQPYSKVQLGNGGTLPSDKWIINSINAAAGTGTTLANALTPNTSTTPDILILGFDIIYSGAEAATVANAMVNYLKAGGVVLMYCENITFNAVFLNALFGTGTSITTPQDGNVSGGRYLISSMNDSPIINGPFGNAGGQYWGEDASTTCTVHGLPANADVTVYSVATAVMLAAGTTAPSTFAATPLGQGLPTMFKHNTLSLFWVGDGGFNSDDCATCGTICPFLVSTDGKYAPVTKPGFTGADCQWGGGSVSNSIVTANALVWAINQAMIKGINTH